MKLEPVYGLHAVITLLERSPEQIMELWLLPCVKPTKG